MQRPLLSIDVEHPAARTALVLVLIGMVAAIVVGLLPIKSFGHDCGSVIFQTKSDGGIPFLDELENEACARAVRPRLLLAGGVLLAGIGVGGAVWFIGQPRTSNRRDEERETAGASGAAPEDRGAAHPQLADQIESLRDLHRDGASTDDEFAVAKRLLLDAGELGEAPPIR